MLMSLLYAYSNFTAHQWCDQGHLVHLCPALTDKVSVPGISDAFAQSETTRSSTRSVVQ
jgi:hypothetical protein